MLIGELAETTGVSARALRHYEDNGLLAPERSSNGYRSYSESDVVLVERIQAMISAGLGVVTIGQFLDCVHGDRDHLSLDICPALRAEFDALAARLDERQAALREKRRRLGALSAGGAGHGLT